MFSGCRTVVAVLGCSDMKSFLDSFTFVCFACLLFVLFCSRKMCYAMEGRCLFFFVSCLLYVLSCSRKMCYAMEGRCFAV